MTGTPPIPLLMLWTAWVAQAVLSAIQARKFSRQFDRKRRDRFDDFRPPVSVIVPFRGSDPCLDAHLAALCEQDYPDYELLLVVDSEHDPAYEALKNHLAHRQYRKARVLVAGPAGPNQGQKVHNQLFAIDQLDASPTLADGGSRVWVFADSDAVPGPRWLADLVGPLCQTDRTGVTTGYRWLIPIARDGRTRPTIWSHLASIMNSSVACCYGRDAFNHAWGGSMGICQATARRGGLRDKLVGALCDDYQFSRVSRCLGLRVYFVPWCVVPTPVDFGFRAMVNFAHRQYLLTRVYAPKLFAIALVLTSLYVAGWFSAWAWVVAVVLGRPGTDAVWWSVGAIALVGLANQARSAYRHRAIKRVVGDEESAVLRTTLRWDRWATPVWMTLHWLLVLRSAFGRTMHWRGISYRLLAAQRVQRLGGT